MPGLDMFSEAVRERCRNWRVTAGFCGVLGSALTVAVVCFSLAWPLLWEPLPYPNATRVTALQSTAKGRVSGLTWGDSGELRRRVSQIEKIAVYSARTWGVQTEREGHVEVLSSLMTTGEFFDVLGVAPSPGSSMTTSHDAVGRQNEAWLASNSASRLYGRPEAALNRTLWVNGAPYRIAGVLPSTFRFPMAQGEPELFIPLSRAEYCCERGGGAQQAIALLTNPSSFGAELQIASSSMAQDFPVTNADVRFVPVEFREQLFGPRLRALRWILAAAICLVLVAGANGAGIWMARWLKTRRDIAIRLSLGASALRLAVIRACEGAIAGGAAATVGVMAAALLMRTASAMPFINDRLVVFAVWRPVALQPTAILAAILVGVALGVMAALLPHTFAMRRLAREGTRAVMVVQTPARRLRLVLTAVQLTATAILGWTTIAIGENVHNLLNTDRGYHTDQTLIAGIGVPEAHYNTDEKMTAFHAAVIEQLRAVPGVTEAAGGVNVPQGNMRTRFLLDGQTLERERQAGARLGVASPELLPLLRMPLRRGREFTRDDRLNSPRVALVNEAFVRTHFPDSKEPLGEGLRLSFYNGFAMKPWTRFQIVGIVADVRNDSLLLEPQPQILIPAAQIAMEGFFYYVRTARPAASIQAELRQAVWRVHPAIESVNFRPLADQVEEGLIDRRALSAFGVVVLVVAGIIVAAGLFASLSASVLESGRELAIRAAVGATPVSLAIESLRWALMAAGIAGVITAVAVPFIAANVRLEKTTLQPTPSSIILCVLGGGLILVVAAFRPVRKAASSSPVEALREQ